MAGRANQITKQKRLERVLQLRGQGKMRFQCLNILADEWGMTERGVQLYWEASNKILKESFTDEDLISSYTYIRDKNIEDNPAIAVKCNDSIAKLKLGGYKKDDNTVIINVTRRGDNDEITKENG